MQLTVEKKKIKNEFSNSLNKNMGDNLKFEVSAPSEAKVPEVGSFKDNNDSNDHDFESLEYEEDVYYRDVAATPSFDDIDEFSDGDEIVVHCWRGSNGDIEEIVVDDSADYSCYAAQSVVDKICNERKFNGVEGEGGKRGNLNFFKDNSFNKLKYYCHINGNTNSGASGKKRRSVRVIFQDLSKPYLAKISSSQNYKKFLEMVKGSFYIFLYINF